MQRYSFCCMLYGLDSITKVFAGYWHSLTDPVRDQRMRLLSACSVMLVRHAMTTNKLARASKDGGIESDKALAWENCAEREALSLQIQLVIHLP